MTVVVWMWVRSKLCGCVLIGVLTSSKSWGIGRKQSTSKEDDRFLSEKEALADVKWLLAEEQPWEDLLAKDNLLVWKMSIKDSPFIAIKATAILDVTPNALSQVLAPGDINIVRSYNPMILDGKDLEYIGKDKKISWSVTAPLWPVRARDFVTAITRHRFPDGSMVLVQRATTHKDAPEPSPTDDLVRGQILHGIMLVEPIPGSKNRTRFTMVHHFNPGGNIPVWFVNWLAEIKPVTFLGALTTVAQQFDELALRYGGKKGYSCGDRGFGDPPCPLLLRLGVSPLADGAGETINDNDANSHAASKLDLVGIIIAVCITCLSVSGAVVGVIRLCRRRRLRPGDTGGTTHLKHWWCRLALGAIAVAAASACAPRTPAI